MKNLLILAALAAVPLPVMAQMTQPEAAPPAPSAPASPGAMPASPPEPPAAAAPAPTDPAAILAAEFGFYDKDKSGDLNQNEFSNWLVTLKTKSSPASANTDAKADEQWAADSFVKADIDKSKTVSVTELTNHLVPVS